MASGRLAGLPVRSGVISNLHTAGHPADQPHRYLNRPFGAGRRTRNEAQKNTGDQPPLVALCAGPRRAMGPLLSRRRRSLRRCGRRSRRTAFTAASACMEKSESGVGTASSRNRFSVLLRHPPRCRKAADWAAMSQVWRREPRFLSVGTSLRTARSWRQVISPGAGGVHCALQFQPPAVTRRRLPGSFEPGPDSDQP
jgi:hypothetical protein